MIILANRNSYKYYELLFGLKDAFLEREKMQDDMRDNMLYDDKHFDISFIASNWMSDFNDNNPYLDICFHKKIGKIEKQFIDIIDNISHYREWKTITPSDKARIIHDENYNYQIQYYSKIFNGKYKIEVINSDKFKEQLKLYWDKNLDQKIGYKQVYLQNGDYKFNSHIVARSMYVNIGMRPSSLGIPNCLSYAPQDSIMYVSNSSHNKDKYNSNGLETILNSTVLASELSPFHIKTIENSKSAKKDFVIVDSFEGCYNKTKLGISEDDKKIYIKKI